jgi:hypothetical protein
MRHTAEALWALPCSPRTTTHTASITVLWVIWKARNRIVFNTDHQDVVSIAQHLRDHHTLRCCKATSKLDVEPHKLRYQTFIDVN